MKALQVALIPGLSPLGDLSRGKRKEVDTCKVDEETAGPLVRASYDCLNRHEMNFRSSAYYQ